MERDDREGAAAAAKYFIGLTPYVLSTLDTDEWDAMRLAECVFCKRVAADSKKYAERAQRETGGELNILDSSVAQGTDKSFLVHIDATEGPTQVVDSEGRAIEERPAAGALSLDILMYRQDGKWRVRAVTVND